MRRLRCDLRGGRLRSAVGGPRFEVSGRRFEVRAIVDFLLLESGGSRSQGSLLREAWGGRESGFFCKKPGVVIGSLGLPYLQSSRSSTTFYPVVAQGDVQLAFGCVLL